MNTTNNTEHVTKIVAASVCVAAGAATAHMALLQQGGALAWPFAILCALGAIVSLRAHFDLSDIVHRFGQLRPDVGGAIEFVADKASRGRVLVVGLWFTFWGGLLLLLCTRPFAAAVLDWDTSLVGWGIGMAVGVYWLFARGLAPAWKALHGPRGLNNSDLVHGDARLATEREAADAARGASGLPPRNDIDIDY